MSRLVVQIPALNEAASIGAVLKAIPRKIEGIEEVLVVVVDDGSSDATGEIARANGAIVARHGQPRGVGAAFRTGMEISRSLGADIVVTIDADGQFNPADIPRLVEPVRRGGYDFVTASRFIDPGKTPAMPAAKKWGNRVIARWLSRMTGQRFYDVSCGFRAYGSRAFLRLIPQGDFTYTHEVFLSLAFAGLRIGEVAVEVRGVREHGESRVARNLLHYAWQAAAIILGTYRDYRPLAFFGAISGFFLAVGFGFLGFVLSHWTQTGALFPYRFLAFMGGASIGSGLLVFLIGLVAAMLSRLRNGMEVLHARLGALEREVKRPEA